MFHCIDCFMSIFHQGSVVVFGAYQAWTNLDLDKDMANPNYCPKTPMLFAFVYLILTWVCTTSTFFRINSYSTTIHSFESIFSKLVYFSVCSACSDLLLLLFLRHLRPCNGGVGLTIHIHSMKNRKFQ